jgi:hypothetical protein
MDKKLSEKQIDARKRWKRRQREMFEENARRKAMKNSAEYQIETFVRDMSYNGKNDPVNPNNLKRDNSELEEYLNNQD